MKEFRLSEEHALLFDCITQEVCRTSRLRSSTRFIQHGSTSVYQHSVAVAYLSCLLAERLHVHADFRALIRAGLLHDYFLYDWHEKDSAHRLHGFRHPLTALHNATMDFDLTATERNAILRHMFPLTPIPPRTCEGWLLTLADKVCALWETVRLTETTLRLIPVYR